MLRHHLTIAFRQIRRQFGYVVINVLGLAVGLACGILSLLNVQDEPAYDQHGKGDRIHKLLRRQELEGQDEPGPGAAGGVVSAATPSC